MMGRKADCTGSCILIALLLAAVIPGGALLAQTSPPFRHHVILDVGDGDPNNPSTDPFDASEQDIRVRGLVDREELGGALVFGDFNGDGLQDLAVGERNANKVYIFFGSEDLDPANSLNPGAFEVTPGGGSTSSTQGTTVINGPTDNELPCDPNNPQPEFGFSLAAGNVNKDPADPNDRLDDLIIGAPFCGGGAYIVYGRSSWSASVDLTDPNAMDPNAIATRLFDGGSGPEALFGFAVAAGDFTNDGVDDIAVSSRNADVASLFATGRVQLIPGALGLEGNSTLDATLASTVTLGGAEEGDFLGEALAFCNVDKDGTPGEDLLIGAIGVDGEGQDGGAFYVVSSQTLQGGGLLRPSAAGEPAANGDFDVQIYGTEAEDSLGFSVACGDVNGDGFDDPIASAFFANGGPQEDRLGGGEVYVFYGNLNFSTFDDPPPASQLSAKTFKAKQEAHLSVFPATGSDQLGFSVASGDLDGDGCAEILAGARRYDADATAIDGGIVYAIRGVPTTVPALCGLNATRPVPVRVDLAIGTGFDPGDPNDRPDYPAAAFDGSSFLADPNSPRCDPNSPYAAPTPCAVSAVFVGNTTGIQAGFATAAGDFDNDSFAEVGIGAIGDGRRQPVPWGGMAFVAGVADNDRDGFSNLSDRDDDNDCLSDGIERTDLMTDHTRGDTDLDGLLDGTEASVRLDPNGAVEFLADNRLRGTFVDPSFPNQNDPNGPVGCHPDPTVPCCIFDQDPDPAGATNPNDPDTDDDCIPDGCVADPNVFPNVNKVGATCPAGVDPNSKGKLWGEDINRDGETTITETNPVSRDTDSDMLPDGLERGVLGGACGDLGTPVGDPNLIRVDQDPTTTTNALLDDSDGGQVLDGGDGSEFEDFNLDGDLDFDPVLFDPNDCASDSYANNETDPNNPDDDRASGIQDRADPADPNTLPVFIDADPGSSNAVRTYLQAGEVCVRLRDTDENRDPNNVETLDPADPALQVNGALGFVSELSCLDPNSNVVDTLSITLTDLNTGFFEGCARLTVDPADPNAATNLLCRVNDRVVYRYRDNDDLCDDRTAAPAWIKRTEIFELQSPAIDGGVLDPNRPGLIAIHTDPNINLNHVAFSFTEAVDPNSILDPSAATVSVAGTMGPMCPPEAPVLGPDPNIQTGFRGGDKRVTCDPDPNSIATFADDEYTVTVDCGPSLAGKDRDPNVPGVKDRFGSLGDCTFDPSTPNSADPNYFLQPNAQGGTASWRFIVDLDAFPGVVVFGSSDDPSVNLPPSTGADPNAVVTTDPEVTVAVTFDQAMQESTVVDPTHWSVTDTAMRAITAAGITYDPAAKRVLFDPNGPPDPNGNVALPDDRYTFTLSPSMTDHNGNALDIDEDPNTAASGFTRGLVVDGDTVPQVSSFISSDPNQTQINPAKVVAGDPNVTVTFTFDQAMEESTVEDPNHWTVAGTMMSVSSTAAVITYDPNTNSVTFDPNVPPDPNGNLGLPDDLYTFDLTDGMHDHNGNPLDDDPNTPPAGSTRLLVVDNDRNPEVRGFSFTGVSTVDPNVATDRQVVFTIDFDQAMEEGSVEDPNRWTFTGPGTPGPFVITYDPAAKTVDFDPDPNTLPDGTYTLTFDGAVDHAGNPLDGDADPNTTGGAFQRTIIIDTTGPVVVEMIPAPTSDPNNAVKSAALTDVVVKLSEALLTAADPPGDPNRPIDPNGVVDPSVFTVTGTAGAVASSSIAYDDPNLSLTFTVMLDPNATGLPDDRYRVFLKGTGTPVLEDRRAGNDLDGECLGGDPALCERSEIDPNTSQTSGNGVPGGDFVAEFVVDADANPRVTAVSLDGTADPNLLCAFTIASASAQTVEAVFSEAMDATSITDATVFVVEGLDPNAFDPNTSLVDPNNLSYDPASRKVTIPVDDPNSVGTGIETGDYLLVLSTGAGTGIRDLNGNPLTNSGGESGQPDFVCRFAITGTVSGFFFVDQADDPGLDVRSGDGTLPSPGGAPDTGMFKFTFLDRVLDTSLTTQTFQILSSDGSADPNLACDSVTLAGNRKTTTCEIDGAGDVGLTPFQGNDDRYEIRLRGTGSPRIMGLGAGGVVDPNLFLDGHCPGGSDPLRCEAGDITNDNNINSGDPNNPSPNDFFTYWFVDIDQVPAVTQMAPPPDANSVDPNTDISVTFDQVMDPASITASSFTVTGTMGSVGGSPTWDHATRSATIDPEDPNGNPLSLPDDLYEVRLHSDPNDPAGSVRDFRDATSGNLLDGDCLGGLDANRCEASEIDPNVSGDGSAGGDFVAQFVVDEDVNPEVAAFSFTGAVDPNTTTDADVVFTLEFDQAMDEGSVEDPNHWDFTDPNGNTTGPFVITYDPAAKTVDFDPDPNTLPGGTYALTFDGATDHAGNPLDGDADPNTAGGAFQRSITIETTGPVVVEMIPAPTSDPNNAVVDPNLTDVVVRLSERLLTGAGLAIDPNTGAVDPNVFTVTGTAGAVASSSIVYDDPNLLLTFTALLDPNLTGLPDDLYRVFLKGTGTPVLEDLVGNDLDGECTGAADPNSCERSEIDPNNNLTSGDGSPGGNFVAKFVVDADANPRVSAVSLDGAADPNLLCAFTIQATNVQTVEAAFSEAMDAGSITDASVFVVAGSDPNAFDPNTTLVDPNTLAYDPGSRRVTIPVDDPNAPGSGIETGDYLLVISTDAGTGVKDLNMNPVTNTGGDSSQPDFVCRFTVTGTVSGFFFMDQVDFPGLDVRSPDGTLPPAGADPNEGVFQFTFLDKVLDTSLTPQTFRILSSDGSADPNLACDSVTLAGNKKTTTCAIGGAGNANLTPFQGNDDRYEIRLRGTGSPRIMGLGAGGFVDPNLFLDGSCPGGIDPLRCESGELPPAASSTSGDPNNPSPNDLFTYWFVDIDQVPAVMQMAPPPDASSVDPNTGISVTFDQVMDPASITASSFTVTGTMGSVGGSPTWDHATRSATIDPEDPNGNPLSLPDDLYEVRLHSDPNDPAGSVRDFRDAMSGNLLDGDSGCTSGAPRCEASEIDPNTGATSGDPNNNPANRGGDFVAQFLVDEDTNPEVTAFSFTGAVDPNTTTDADVVFTLEFDQAMEEGSVEDPNHWDFTDPNGNTTGPFVITYDPAAKTVDFDPDPNTLPDGTYALTFDGATDHAGNPLDGDADPNTAGGAFQRSITISTGPIIVPLDMLLEVDSSGMLSWTAQPAAPGGATPTYNLYRGSMAELQQTGIYTQDSSVVGQAEAFCAVSSTSYGDGYAPVAGTVVFYLVAENIGGSDGLLGTDSDGTPRPSEGLCTGITATGSTAGSSGTTSSSKQQLRTSDETGGSE